MIVHSSFRIMLLLLMCATLLFLVQAFHLRLGVRSYSYRLAFSNRAGLVSGDPIFAGRDATAPMHLTMKPEAAAAIVANFRSDFLKTLNTLLRAYTSKGIYPILNVSNSIHKLHPDPRDRTREKLLGGLMNVTKVEFLESLPENDPRRNGLATIVYPDSERRAELDRNLKALDKYFYPLTDIRTREVYETVARLGFDEKAIFENEVMTSSEIIPVLEEVDRRRDELLSWASLAERRIFNGIFMYLDFDFRPPDLGEDEDEYEDDDF